MLLTSTFVSQHTRSLGRDTESLRSEDLSSDSPAWNGCEGPAWTWEQQTFLDASKRELTVHGSLKSMSCHVIVLISFIDPKGGNHNHHDPICTKERGAVHIPKRKKIKVLIKENGSLLPEQSCVHKANGRQRGITTSQSPECQKATLTKHRSRRMRRRVKSIGRVIAFGFPKTLY